MGDAYQPSAFIGDPESRYDESLWNIEEQDKRCKRCLEALAEYKIIFEEEDGPAVQLIPRCTIEDEASKCRRCASDNAVCEQITDEDIQAQGQSFVIELESLCATREEFDEGHGRYAEHPNTGKSYRRPDHALVEQWYLAHALSVLKAQVEHEAKEEEQKRLARESRKQRKLARRTLAMQTDIASSLKEITLTLKRQQRLLASLYAKR